MAQRIGRPPKCGGCGECHRCKRAAYMREWWRGLPPAERREKTRRRDPDKAREQDRRKQQKRRTEGTDDQLLRIAARNEVRKARLRGDLIPGPCELANEDCDGPINAHHDDYTKPLKVRWMCRHHHDIHHEPNSGDQP